MSEKLYETRHIYLTIGVCIPIFAPFLLLFVPQTIAQLLYYTNDTWYVFTPGENYIAYGIGCFFIFLSTMFLFFIGIRKISIYLCIFCIVLSIACFIMASLSYKSLSDEEISYRSIFSTNHATYSWDDVDAIRYEKIEEKGRSEYTIIFTDGNSMRLKNDGYFKAIEYKFYKKLDEINIILDTVD
ncbi:hypothetical protein ACFSTA_17705 [Ornithinibacillus salinisoli]|uniref:Bacterial PH domain-containing protein n=1 Tax=Ornithinibacillus salinisoli TaxID=1848459 RepID=A0ABW4W449_9BACI